jgi:hypothetical protein
MEWVQDKQAGKMKRRARDVPERGVLLADWIGKVRARHAGGLVGSFRARSSAPAVENPIPPPAQ